MSPAISKRSLTSAYGNNSEEISRCLSWVRKLARRFDILPRSLIVHGVKKTEDNPCRSGGNADVYKGSYDNKAVALKLIRFIKTESFTRRIHKVSR